MFLWSFKKINQKYKQYRVILTNSLFDTLFCLKMLITFCLIKK